MLGRRLPACRLRTVRSWDRRIEQARYEELCEHWRATAAAVERGDYRVYPVGHPVPYAEFFEEFAGLESTAIDLPGLDDETNRIAILTAANSPSYFALRHEHQELRKERDQAIRAFFVTR